MLLGMGHALELLLGSLDFLVIDNHGHDSEERRGRFGWRKEGVERKLSEKRESVRFGLEYK